MVNNIRHQGNAKMPKSKKVTILSLEMLECSYVAAGNARWKSLFGKQFGSFL